MKDLTEIVAAALKADRALMSEKVAQSLARSVLDALRDAGALVEWRGIESAPRDGSAFLAYGGGLDEVETCRYNLRVGCWDAETCTLDDLDCEPQGFDRPTHWSPLPKPPEGA